MTLPTLQSWPDFDIDDALMSETVINFDNAPKAFALAGEHQDAIAKAKGE